MYLKEHTHNLSEAQGSGLNLLWLGVHMHHMSQTNWARRSYDVASNVHHIDWLKTRGKLANIIRREKHTGWISALSKSGGSKDEDCPSTREHA